MNLDQAQAEVVNAKDDLLVLAGPGSGKTTAMAQRIKQLSKAGHSTLGLSFTKKSATELKHRVGDIGEQDFIGTFHSFCFQLLKRQGRVRIVPPALKLKFFHNNKQLALEVDKARAGQPASDAVLELAQRYQTWLDKLGMLDFDDLLKRAFELLDEPLFEHVVVDEVQDNNQLQYQLLPKLGRHITLIGDVDQSIYGFRGAQPRLVREFQQERQPHTLYLENNYRCARNICQLAQGVIEQDPQRFEKETRPMRQEDGLIRWREALTLWDELAWIMERLQDGNCPTILCRSNAPLIEIEKELVSALWPCQRRGGLWERVGMMQLKERLSNSDCQHPQWHQQWLDYMQQLMPQQDWEKTMCRKLAELPRSERAAVKARLLEPGPLLSTIHASKGLEWPSVALIGLRVEEFPKRDADREEELRLLYVAITRAMNQLWLLGDQHSPFGELCLDQLLLMRCRQLAA